MSKRKSVRVLLAWLLPAAAFLGVLSWMSATMWDPTVPIIGLLPEWFPVASGMVGLAALYAAIVLRRDPPRAETAAPPTLRQRRWLEVARYAAWLATVGALTLGVRHAVDGALAENWLELPTSLVVPFSVRLSVGIVLSYLFLKVALFAALSRKVSLGIVFFLACAGSLAAILFTGAELAVSLPDLAAALFLVPTLLLRPPYLRRSPARWVLRVRATSKEERERSRRLTRYVDLFRVYEKKKCKEIDGPRGKIQVGERWLFRRLVLLAVVIGDLLGVAALVGIERHYMRSAPDALAAFEKDLPAVTTRVLDAKGGELCSYTLMNRTWVPLERIPARVQEAFIAAEDKNFYRHWGVDPVAMIRAAKHNFEDDGSTQGASTITQQVVKIVILRDPSRSLDRKIPEIFLAARLERELAAKYGRRRAKELILERYLNEIFLGENAYGVQAAAETYFGKDVKDLTLAEAAVLAGLSKAPSRDSPAGKHPELAKGRQAYVLRRMLEQGSITHADREAASEERLIIVERGDDLNKTSAPHACVMIRRWATKRYGEDAIFERGLVIRTTIDPEMQRVAQDVVHFGMMDLERRLGFAGPEGHDDAFDGCDGPKAYVPDHFIEPNAQVASVGDGASVCVRGDLFPLDEQDVVRVRKWEEKSKKRLAIGDVLTVRILTKEGRKGGEPSRVALTARRTSGPRALQAGLVAVDPRTGRLLAHSGGFDFAERQHDMVRQAKRQPGSSIKPLVYANGFEHGMTVLDTYVDEPGRIGDWSFENYLGKNTTRQYMGRVSVRTAMAKSLNSVSVWIARDYGFEEVLRLMRRMGYVSPMKLFPTLALGSEAVTPWEHVYGYATIAANGKRMPKQPGSEMPGIFVTEVLDERWRTLERFEQAPEGQALSSGAAYLTQYVMKAVIEDGTGRKARVLGRPVIGKTGTSNDFKDAWFIGCTVDLCVGVWIGRELPSSISDDKHDEPTGGSIATPLWVAFMQAVAPVTDDAPAREFPAPSDVLLMGESGDLPFQTGHVPDELLSGVSDDFDEESFR